ncbi:MAG: plasmid recombination protein [Oscillospiraceae bacterium]|nr:plasmid recombination protein [Oscillospiraceae bacterium]MDY6207800.1 plasmid recombination protein [Oscillospiraceae bacterium]
MKGSLWIKEKDVLKIINSERKKQGLSPLEKQKKIRIDAVVMCATIIKPPKEFMSTLTQEQQQQFFIDAVEKFKSIVGSDNVKSVVVHYDELVPHAHIFWQPVTEDGRLCAKEMHNLHFLGTLNREMPKYLREKGWTQIDDCHAYDAEEAQKLREEMGDDVYREYRRSQKAKQGRDSKKYKDDMDNAVAEAQQRLCCLDKELGETTERLNEVKAQAEKEIETLCELQYNHGLYEQLLDGLEEEIHEKEAELTRKQSIPLPPIKPFGHKPTLQIYITREQYIKANLQSDLGFRERIQREKMLGNLYDKQFLEYQDQIARWEQWEKDYEEYNEKYGMTAIVKNTAEQQVKIQKEQAKIAEEQAEKTAQLKVKEKRLIEIERELFYAAQALAKQAAGKLSTIFEILCNNLRKGLINNENHNRGNNCQYENSTRLSQKGYENKCSR